MDGAIAGVGSWPISDEIVLLCDQCGHHGFKLVVDREPEATEIRAIKCLQCSTEFSCFMCSSGVCNN